jgi:signal peptidase I
MSYARLFGGLVMVVFTFVAVRTVLVEPVTIKQVSMEPTLVGGDTVLVAKWCRWATGWGSGDVVALRAPDDGALVVKRIVATAGQRVGLRDGRLAVDGRAAPSDAVSDALDGVYFGPVRVPPRTVFVMGDNRARSVDSRAFGSVGEDSIMGCVVGVAWPPGHAGPLKGLR